MPARWTSCLQTGHCATRACLPETISLADTCLLLSLPSAHLSLIHVQAHMWVATALYTTPTKCLSTYTPPVSRSAADPLLICLQVNWSSDGCCMTGTCTRCTRSLCASSAAWLAWWPSRALVGTTRQPGSAAAASLMLHPAQMSKLVTAAQLLQHCNALHAHCAAL